MGEFQFDASERDTLSAVAVIITVEWCQLLGSYSKLTYSQNLSCLI